MLGFLKYEIPYSIDDPQRTIWHKKIILEKPFLKKLYLDWYNTFINAVPNLPKNGILLEIGSGGGFLKDVLPQVTTSDILPLESIDYTFSALDIPFENNSVRAIFLVDTFHHIPDAKKFLSEVSRVLKKDGQLIMIEPCNSIWGRFIYKNFHHEPFEENEGWSFKQSGPLSGANIALPWIVFQRDYKQYNEYFPNLKIKSIQYHTPIKYILSGGVSMKALVPNFTYSFFNGLEKVMNPISKWFSMHMTITITKVSDI